MLTKKEYVFRSTKTIEKEDFVIAESYEEAEKIFSDYLYCGAEIVTGKHSK